MAEFRWWTPEEDALLNRLYSDVSKSRDEICTELNRTWYSIVERTQILKLHRPMPNAWTDEEITLLRRLYPDTSVSTEDIGAILGRSASAVRQRARLLGLERPYFKRKRNPNEWLIEEEKFVEQHYTNPHVSISEIAIHLQRSEGAIIERAKKLGLRRPFPNKYNINKRYFQEITTHEQAYFLGLLAADGSVSAHGTIELELQERDAMLVERFRNAIAPELPLKKKNGIRLMFGSVEMAADLARYGVVPRKSYNFSWPKALPEEFSMTFVLGYFDGDGSLRQGTPGNWGWELLGCYDFLCEVRTRLEAGVGVKLPPPTQAKPKVSPHLYRMQVTSANKVIRIDYALNTSRLGLPRKHVSEDKLFLTVALTLFPELRKTLRR